MSNSKIVIDVAEGSLYSARLQTQLFELHLQRFNCHIVAQGVLEEIRKIHSTAINLDTDTAPIWLEGGQKLLKQASWSLINSILRHGRDITAIRLCVSKIDIDVFFSVTDSGKGLQLQNLTDLFTPFKILSTASDSVGLRLSTTEKIVALHGGKILVDTIDGHGTIIPMSLPKKPPPTKEDHDGQRSLEHRAGTGG